LGRSIKEMRNELKVLNARYSLNVCGEGGEYETLTLDSPLYTKGRLELLMGESELVTHNSSNTVFYLRPKVKFIPK
jgi:diphthine-ammonia ligase